MIPLSSCDEYPVEHDQDRPLEPPTSTVDETPPSTAEALPTSQSLPPSQPRTRRRIVSRRSTTRREEPPPPLVPASVWQDLLRDSGLPSAYDWELPKTFDKIHQLQASHVALQMPEGLLLYATVLADVLKRVCSPRPLEVSILGDVTYGACCVDDLGAKALGADLLVHYGHSCLVPIQHTKLPCLYVFVQVHVDVEHFVQCVRTTLTDPNTTISLLGTIQFRPALAQAKEMLSSSSSLQQEPYAEVQIPQVKPLSPGEVLGCTSPSNIKSDVVVFCADGRFHLEATMIANPQVSMFLRYDPYSKTLTKEVYQWKEMTQLRDEAIHAARRALQQQPNVVVGVILGTLGRQGNPAIWKRIRDLLQSPNPSSTTLPHPPQRKCFLLLLSEITPAKLQTLSHVNVWVQIACPRLSVDWGHLFTVPLLSPYEFFVCLEEQTSTDATNTSNHDPLSKPYPMDFYAQQGGPWSNYFETNKNRQCGNHHPESTMNVKH